MEYRQMLKEIQNPKNKLFRHVRCMMAGIENIKYSVHDEHNKVLFEVYGSEQGESAPSQFRNAVLIDEKEQHSCSLKQVHELFMVLHDRYGKEEKTKEMFLQSKQKVI